MKKFVPSLLTCVLILLSAASVFSQPGQAEKRFSDAGGGYSFAVPAGFNAQQSGEGFVAANAAQTVTLLINAHSFQTFEQFAAQSNLENDGLTLMGRVADFGDKKGKYFRASGKSPQGGVLIVDTFVLFSPYGGGALVVALTEFAHRRAGLEAGFDTASAVAFAKPQTSAADGQLQAYFSGKHLIYLYTSGGFSERTDIHLCPSGQFSFRSDSSSTSVNGSGAVGSGSAGNWKVSSRGGGALILQFRNGSVSEYKLSRGQTSGQINLNGNRYFVQTSNECPGR